MTLSLSDHTLGAAGQGSFMDTILRKNPDICGELLHHEQISVAKSQAIGFDHMPCPVCAVLEYTEKDNSRFCPVKESSLAKKSGVLHLIYPVKKENSLDPMHPIYDTFCGNVKKSV